ncbi:MAG: ABC transporter permease [Candidatus Woesearchaeota archaeon]|nr:ABC transporter permease [Candidatus Woesearchaeota archaeon]
MIGKNLKIIFRSPFTILLLVLAPILLMFVVGFTYSGTSLSDTNIGLIETETQMFDAIKVRPELREVNFIEYYDGGYNQSRDSCKEDLKQSKVHLCMSFIPYYDRNGNLLSANIIYYIDNTRPQISDIIVRNFNVYIDDQTKIMSEKTINDIFSEVNETLSFMEDSKELIDDLLVDINTAKINLEDAIDLLEEGSKEYDVIYSQVLNQRYNINTQISSLEEDSLKLDNDLDDLDSEINSLSNSLPSQISMLTNTINGINTYAQTNPEIYNYVDIGDLNELENDLENLEDNLDDVQSTSNSVSNNLGAINDINNLQMAFNTLIDSLGLMKGYMDTANSESQKLLYEMNIREKELTEIRDQIDDKLAYFKEVTNRDASDITEPISKKNLLLWTGLQRVHQLSPVIVILVLLFIGLLLSNVVVSLEINSNAYFRNLISPVKQGKFVLSLFFTSMLIILFQMFFLFLIIQMVFKIEVFTLSKLFSVGLVVILILMIFVLTGIFLAYLFSSIQISILFTTFLMLFLFLLSDIIVPLEIMPKIFSTLLRLNPVIIGEDLIRRLFFIDEFSLSLKDIIIFIPYNIILIVLVTVASRMRVKNMF